MAVNDHNLRRANRRHLCDPFHQSWSAVIRSDHSVVLTHV